MRGAWLCIGLAVVPVAVACSRSELFDDEAMQDGPDAATLEDGAADAAATRDAFLERVTCPQAPRDVCGTTMYEPGAPWPTYQRCSSHASRTSAVGPKNPVQLWSAFVDPGEILGPPTIGADGTIYLCSGGVEAFSKDGTLLWANGEPAPFGTTPVAIGPDGTLFTAGAAVYAQTPNGSTKWVSNQMNAYLSVSYGFDVTGASVTLGPCGTIYVGAPNGLYTIDAESGDWIWVHNDQVTSTPAVGDDGVVYYQNLDNALVALNLDGSVKWTFTPADAPTIHLPWIEAAPMIGADGTIYYAELSGLYAVSGRGELLWETAWTSDGGAAYVALGLGADGTVYAVTPESTFEAVAPGGGVKWALPIGANGTSPVIGGDGTIYELGSAGLYAITPDGDTAWIFPLYEAPMGALAMAADGTLIVSAAGLYAIGDAQ